MVQPLQKTLWTFLKKLKIELPCDPAILLLGIYPEEKKKKTQILKDMQPNVHGSIFIIAKIWKPSRVHQQMNG